MKKLDILQCDFAFKCPLTWDQLAETVNTAVRYCGSCEQHVFLCKTQADVDYHNSRLHCVALKQSSHADLWDEGADCIMGQEEVVPEYKGPLMTLVMMPTYSLSNDQLKLLQRSFGLQGSSHEIRSRYCQGTDQILQKGLAPKQASSISATLMKYGIVCRQIVERENAGVTKLNEFSPGY